MIERITIDPSICDGKPCIRGPRYPAENVPEWLAGGMTIEDILADYEDLTREDILSAPAFAARMAHTKYVVNRCRSSGVVAIPQSRNGDVSNDATIRRMR